MLAQTEGEQNFNRRYFETVRLVNAAANLGRTALQEFTTEDLAGYERRQYDEIHSAVVEGLKGTVRTHYTFELRNGKLVAEDGEIIDELMERGLEESYELARKDPFYEGFVPQRAEAELVEHLDNQAMANGLRSYNTSIKFSPYSEEYDTSEVAREKLVHAAQKPYFKRAMLRLSHWDGQKLHIFTRSIDNSSVETLKEVAARKLAFQFGADDNSTQLLAKSIHLDIKDSGWLTLPDEIIDTADKLISSRLGKESKQGRPIDDATDLEAFVAANRVVIENLVDEGRSLSLSHTDYESYQKAFEKELYDHLALLSARLEMNNYEQIIDITAAAGAAGAFAEANGVVFDMCGLVISPNQAQPSSTNMGFESLLRLQNKKITCPECKSKVVVPTEDLKQGRLTCKDCGHGVDVCTGEKFSKRNVTQKAKAPDIFDLLVADLKKYDLEAREKSPNLESTKKEKSTSWIW